MKKWLLTGFLLALSGCAAWQPQPNPLPSSATPPSPAPPVPRLPVAPAPTPPPAIPLPASAPAARTLWQRMRQGFVMPSCNADPAILRTAQRLTRRPQVFDRQIARALPLIRMGQQLVEVAGIPSEFTLLPLVESSYRPDALGRGGFVGMWQFGRSTARLSGLDLLDGYDGRRDPWASTLAATRLIRSYGQQFGDWRLAVLAYNRGLGAVQHWVARYGMPAPQPVVPDWPLPRVARHYLLRLLAYACIVREPERFDIQLPGGQHLPGLRLVRLSAPLDMGLAARLAGMSRRNLDQLNAGYLDGRMPRHGPDHLLLPAAAHQRFVATYAMLSASTWSHFAPYHLRRYAHLQSLQLSKIDPLSLEQIARLNNIDPQQRLRPGYRLWLPKGLHLRNLQQVSPRPAWGAVHRVRRGDSLWSIARQYRLTVAELQRWNHLHRTLLHPGKILHLYPPD